MNRYISDLHFAHENCNTFDRRGFASSREMDEYIIAQWNSEVTIDDNVYILGDVCIQWDEYVKSLVRRLNGNLVLVRGNHDHVNKHSDYYEVFYQIEDYLELRDGNDHVILFHFPILNWNRMRSGSIHLYAHVHRNTPRDLHNAYNTWCVGCGYIPRPLTWYKEKFGYNKDAHKTFSMELASNMVSLN